MIILPRTYATVPVLLLFSRQTQLHGMQVDRFSMDGIRFIRNVKQTALKENFLLLPLRS